MTLWEISSENEDSNSFVAVFSDSEGNKLSTTVYKFSGNIFGCVDLCPKYKK